MRRIVTRIVEETIEEAFTVVFDEQKRGIKTQIRDIVEGSLIIIVDQGRLDTILVRNMDKLTKSTRFMDALTRRFVSSTLFITPVTKFVRKQVERMEKKYASRKNWNNSSENGDDVDLTAPLELIVTEIRSLHTYTTRTVSIE